jgi:hypothetical protein
MHYPAPTCRWSEELPGEFDKKKAVWVTLNGQAIDCQELFSFFQRSSGQAGYKS